MATNHWQNPYKARLLTPTIKMMLVASSYSPSVDDQFVASASAHEISCSGYVGGFGGTGRKTLNGPTVTKDVTTGKMRLDFTRTTYAAIGTPAGVTARYLCLILEDGTGDANSALIATLDAKADLSDIVLYGGALNVDPPGNGLLLL